MDKELLKKIIDAAILIKEEVREDVGVVFREYESQEVKIHEIEGQDNITIYASMKK